MDAQYTFQRFEKKYLLTPLKYRRLQRTLKDRMAEDEYGRYTIVSVYFDTDAFDIIRTSVQQPIFKEKLRLRWYGEGGDDAAMFWELKRKYRGRVYKRRIPAQPCGVSRLLRPDEERFCQGQIAREVEWFVRRYRPVPKLLLAYDREAFQSPGDRELRVTFDHRIRWRDRDFGFSHGSGGTPLLEGGTVLMEIKACGNLPIWLTELLAAEKLYPSSFSKYGTWYETVHLRKGTSQHAG